MSGLLRPLLAGKKNAYTSGSCCIFPIYVINLVLFDHICQVIAGIVKRMDKSAEIENIGA